MEQKGLSINIQMFREIDLVNKNFIGGFTQITIFEDEKKMDFYPVVFYNNPADKKYFMIYSLISSSEDDKNIKIKPLGDFLIYDRKTQVDKFGEEDTFDIGIFGGTIGSNSGVFNVKICEGKYEMAILGKEILDWDEVDKIRTNLRMGLFDNFSIFASFPFNVVKQKKL